MKKYALVLIIIIIASSCATTAKSSISSIASEKSAPIAKESPKIDISMFQAFDRGFYRLNANADELFMKTYLYLVNTDIEEMLASMKIETQGLKRAIIRKMPDESVVGEILQYEDSGKKFFIQFDSINGILKINRFESTDNELITKFAEISGNHYEDFVEYYGFSLEYNKVSEYMKHKMVYLSMKCNRSEYVFSFIDGELVKIRFTSEL